jgi:Carboxypeptidase regulatory-like domain/TonB dependent receptor
MTCSLRLIGLGLMATLVLPQPLQAQAGVSVTGVVLDESGAPIPGASVALTGGDPAGTHRTVSEQDGSFTIESVTPASYMVSIELSGFQTYQKATMVAPDLKPLRVTLQLARVEQEVTVEADVVDEGVAAGSNTGTTRLGDEIQKLPIASDDLFSVIGRFISPIGLGTEGPSIVVDGVAGGQLDQPSSAISSIRINRNPYSAAFQYPGNGRLEVSTNRGHRSRRLDGTFQTASRSSVFAARNAFAKSEQDLDRRLLQSNLGGVLNRKSSFFLAAKGLVNHESSLVNAVTLTGPVVENVPAVQRHNSLFGRLQFWPSALHSLYLTYGYSDRPARNRGSGGFNLPERGYDTDESKHRVTLNQNVLLPPNWSNTFLASFARQQERAGSPANAPAIVVNQAFAGGPSQVFSLDKRGSLDLENTTRYYGIRGHSLTFGGRYQTTAIDSLERSNFGGTFEFANLSQLAAGTPLFFRINQGEPQATFNVHEVNGFFEDQIVVTRQLTITGGLRYDWQSTTGDGNNVAPRLSVAFVPSPGSKTVIRGGAGVFYDDYPRSATKRSLLFDGVRLRETVIAGPSYPNPNPLASGQIVSPPHSTIRTDPDLRSPHLEQASVGIEHELWKRNRLSVEYMAVRGVHLFRSRNINAPEPGTGRRPDPAFLNINQIESTGFARSHAVTVSWRGRLGQIFRPYAQYVLSKTTNNTSGVFSLPANNFALQAETGPADFDQRHRLNLIGTLALPKAVQTGLVLSVGSGLPYNITTGFDDNGDALANDRPPGVTRNAGRGPYTIQLDLRFAKTLARSRRGEQGQKRDGLDIMVDVFNAINRTNVNSIVGVLSSPFFGRANSAAAARTVQFSLQYSFRR